MAQQNTFTVGKYLAARLEQMGLQHYFVVPGDYNLMLLGDCHTYLAVAQQY